MFVCVCNQVTEEKILELIEKYQIKDIDKLREIISISNNCLVCERYIENLISLHN